MQYIFFIVLFNSIICVINPKKKKQKLSFNSSPIHGSADDLFVLNQFWIIGVCDLVSVFCCRFSIEREAE